MTSNCMEKKKKDLESWWPKCIFLWEVKVNKTVQLQHYILLFSKVWPKGRGPEWEFQASVASYIYNSSSVLLLQGVIFIPAIRGHRGESCC